MTFAVKKYGLVLGSLHKKLPKRTTLLVAAYDAGLRTSEGHVARNIIQQLDKRLRIVLVTRCNNVQELKADPDFAAINPNVHLVGFDLPKWAIWWKKGPRGYGLYTYLWQITWPFVLGRRRWLASRFDLVHTLNFHNDSIPNMGWVLGRPTIWGPINHHEIVANWRRKTWPLRVEFRHIVKFAIRRLQWRFDPLLRLAISRSDIIISAGPWVNRRLHLTDETRLMMRSQLGVVDELTPIQLDKRVPDETLRLVCPGRLDWIKGVDIAIEALALLPEKIQLDVIGNGPAESNLKSLAQHLGVSHRVNFKTTVKREELFRIIAGCDLLLFPSAEVAGLIWVEALSCGTPVVAFDGFTEVANAAKNLPGINLASAGASRKAAVSNYAEMIKKAAEQPIDRFLIAQSVVQHYSWSSLANEVGAVYQRLKEQK